MPYRVAEQDIKGSLPLARVFNAFTIIGAGYCTVFGTYFFSLHYIFLAAVHILSAVIIAGSYPVIKIKKKFEPGINFILFIGNFVVAALFATGGLDNTGYLWPLAYLPFATIITNRRYTVFWVTLLFGSCLFAVALQWLGFITIPYSGPALFSYFTALTMLTVCVFLFQRTTIDYEEYIRNRDKADITIRRQAALIQMLPDGIVYGDAQNRIISMNAGAEKMMAVTMDEAIGKNVDELLTVEPVRTTREKNRDTLKTQGYLRTEMALTNRNGEKFTVLASVKTLEKQADNQPGWVTIYTDISPLKLNEELKEALEKLEKNNEYLEQLAYISAHDIKSPIITVEGLVERLGRSTSVKDENGQLLKLLTNTVKQMKTTNGALNSVLKARKNIISNADNGEHLIPLRSIFDEVVTTLQPDITAAGAMFEIKIDELAEMLFPEVQFKSIFHNLLSNAIKFRSAERQLNVKVAGTRLPDGRISFVIQDNGTGIDLNAGGDKLFGIFKRFHPHIEGSGVGLHIVKSIIDACNGRIEVESEEGKGTTFKIYFSAIAFGA